MKLLAAAVACLVVCAFSVPALAVMPLHPLPGLVAQSDLIAQAKLVKAGEPAERVIYLPELNLSGRLDDPRPAPVWVRTDTVKIEKIYRDVTGKLKEGDEIEITTRAQPVEPPHPVGGPVARVTGGAYYPQLAAGQSYVLLLRSMGGAKGYNLPGYFKCITPAEQVNERLGSNATGVFDVEKWNWGKPDESGLQLGIPMVEAFPGRPAVQVFVAVRNKSDKPLTLTFDSEIKPLSLKVATSAPDEKAVALPDLYAQVKSDLRMKQPVELQPGRVQLISVYGATLMGTPLPGPLGPGHYNVTFTYTVSKDALAGLSAAAPQKKDAPATTFWTGKIESAPARFEVK